MAASQVAHPNLQLVDITDSFCNAVNKLEPGQLVKDEGFTLFEAVAALEIGDPKMDSGCDEFNHDTHDEIDISIDLSPGQVLWIIDELLRREVAWHQGYPLSQTLFTSIHIDRLLWPDPKTLDDARFDRASSACPVSHQVLRAYCLGLVKCCDMVLVMITGQHYYEEEDFASQLYNRELLRRFQPDEVIDEIQHANAALRTAGWPSTVADLVENRLQHRYSLLRLLTENVSRPLPQKPELASFPHLVRVDPASSWSTAVFGAFSIKLQSHLASSVPPRPMIAVEMSVVHDFMDHLAADISATFELFACTAPGDLFVAFWTLMSRTPQPSIYVRALAQSFLDIQGQVLGIYGVNDSVVDDLESLVLPGSEILNPANQFIENPFDSRFRVARQVEQFVAKVGPSYINQLRSFCQNRSRVRRNLCHALIEWDNIQAEAEEIDSIIQSLTNEQPRPFSPGEDPTFSFSLSSWVYHYKLTQLRLEVQMGFELSVYALHEYSAMYWYLSYVASIHLSHLERISFFVSRRADNETKLEATLKMLYRHFSYLKAVDTLSSALHRLCVVLQRHGHMAKIKHGYANDKLRFDLRMRPFQFLSIPEPLSYEDVDRLSSLRSLSDEQILNQAAQLSTTSKRAWEEVLKAGWHARPLRQAHTGASDVPAAVIETEWTKDTKNSLKACISTGIVISTVSRAIKANNATGDNSSPLDRYKVTVPAVEDVNRFHQWWPVPQITP